MSLRMNWPTVRCAWRSRWGSAPAAAHRSPANRASRPLAVLAGQRGEPSAWPTPPYQWAGAASRSSIHSMCTRARLVLRGTHVIESQHSLEITPWSEHNCRFLISCMVLYFHYLHEDVAVVCHSESIGRYRKLKHEHKCLTISNVSIHYIPFFIITVTVSSWKKRRADFLTYNFPTSLTSYYWGIQFDANAGLGWCSRMHCSYTMQLW